MAGTLAAFFAAFVVVLAGFRVALLILDRTHRIKRDAKELSPSRDEVLVSLRKCVLEILDHHL
jgi:hypothetical protein